MQKKYKVCLVVADYYNSISNNLYKEAVSELNKSKKFKFKHTKIYVPGVFEIPTVISKLINKYDGFISLGCVIKGKTPHFDFISKTAMEGIMKLSINYKKPITNGIITCLNKNQAIERSNTNTKNKGREAAIALIRIINIK